MPACSNPQSCRTQCHAPLGTDPSQQPSVHLHWRLVSASARPPDIRGKRDFRRVAPASAAAPPRGDNIRPAAAILLRRSSRRAAYLLPIGTLEEEASSFLKDALTSASDGWLSCAFAAPTSARVNAGVTRRGGRERAPPEPGRRAAPLQCQCQRGCALSAPASRQTSSRACAAPSILQSAAAGRQPPAECHAVGATT